MKKRLTFIILVCLSFGLFASEGVKKELISSDIQHSHISFSFDNYTTQSVETEMGDAVILKLDDATPILIEGAPEVLKLTASVIIPDMANMLLEVINTSYTDYENVLLAPSKGNLTRDIDPESVPYAFGKAYEQDAFYPGTLAELRDPFIIRDYRGQTIVTYPFQYNPVTKVLRVYHSMEVMITATAETGINPFIRESDVETMDISFKGIYERQFLNFNATASRYTPVDEFGKMLIISHADFINAMQPLIDWKRQCGKEVEIMDVALIGNASAIKTYIADYYNNKGLTFVLLVGDAPAYVPSSNTSAGDSDQNYAYIVGNDHYPDLFIGRFSAENVDHVETMVERTIDYEKNPFKDQDWFTIGTGIASAEGPGDDGEYDYQHIRNIHDDLLGYTYTYCNELFDGSQGGNDLPGNPSPNNVADAVNAGTSVINYTGHGSDNAWSTSGFSSNDVNNLTNNGMLPFIFDVACVNGNFVSQGCFAEAWMRAEHNDEPAGAIGVFASTINQSWNPPMCGQDEMNDVMVESYNDNIKHTYGALCVHGCFLMNDEYGGQGDEMTDTWTLFGDPSLVVRTDVPADMAVTYPPTIFVGATSLTINDAPNGALVCIMMNGSVLATGIVDGNSITMTFSEITAPGDLDITITAYNYTPHLGVVGIVPATMPYVVFDDYAAIDITGNNNGAVDYGEDIRLSIDMENIGAVDAEDVFVSISTNDQEITLYDDEEDYGFIGANSIKTIEGGFAFTVPDDIPDQHIVSFDVYAVDSYDSSWNSNFEVVCNAPVLVIESLTIDDNASGNGNGRLDPGEEATIRIKNSNAGHCIAPNTYGEIVILGPFVEALNTIHEIGDLGMFGPSYTEFDVIVDEDAPDGCVLVDFDYTLRSGGFIENKVFTVKIGLLYDDFETGNFNKFPWQQDGDLPWQTNMQYPYQGNFDVISGNIGGAQTSELKLQFNVMTEDSITFIKKVSSASGDKLKFYINNTLIEDWSGTGEGWTREAFNVTPGSYTFRWVYQKDGSGTSGADKAWVDFVTFPPMQALICWAGPDDEVCEGNDFQCNGEAQNYTSLEWTTSGTGTFDDPTSMNPVYTPSPEDLTTGTTVLTLTVSDDNGNTVDDIMNLSFTDIPEAPATPEGPDYVDVLFTTTSIYNTAGSEEAQTYIWTIDPADAGSISGEGTQATVEWNTEYIGLANISVKGVNDCGEGEFSEAFEVTVDNTVGIDGIDNNLDINIYPNPNNGYFTLNLNGSQHYGLNIRIVNTVGVEVFAQNIQFNGKYTKQIDLSKLAEGMYFLIIEGEGVYLNDKIVLLK